ncbi:MAG: methyltransferase domain-containing protein [Planctomycetes bacterium]|nr:methyltransferase domain-containing protein [Planctomycetota bacterium]
MPPWLLPLLACPRDDAPLQLTGERLRCPSGHEYPVVDGVPVLLIPDEAQTMELAHASIKRAFHDAGADPRAPELYLESLGVTDEQREGVARMHKQGASAVDPAVSFLIQATCGNMYKHLIGRLEEYPIPELRLPPGEGRLLLDLGCSWGRWTFAAARKDYRVVGIDPSLGAVMAARRVATELKIDAAFLVADARFPPFATDTFDTVFSYSVLQHLDPDHVETCLTGCRRVLKPGGFAFIQMAQNLGLRCLYHQARRGFRKAKGFEVRYWSTGALRRTFSQRIGPTSIEAEGYFGIGLQPSDAHLLPWHLRCVLSCSEALRKLSSVLRPLVYMADSAYVRSVKQP